MTSYILNNDSKFTTDYTVYKFTTDYLAQMTREINEVATNLRYKLPNVAKPNSCLFYPCTTVTIAI